MIELMIVIAIIAILVALALAPYQDYTIRTKVSEALSVAAAAKIAVAETCQSDPNLSPDNSSVGYDFAPSTYVSSVIIGGSCSDPHIFIFTANIGTAQDVSLVLNGNYDVNSGHIMWNCVRLEGENRFVPASCRV